MGNVNKKIGLFFGAGAEIGYGMPDGGRFAIDVFRTKQNEARGLLRDSIRSINSNSRNYIVTFMPADYLLKNVTVFNKTQFTSIFKDSLKTHRHALLDALNNFDDVVVKSALSSNELKEFKSVLERISGLDDIDDFTFREDVKLADALNTNNNGNQLFNSSIVSAAIKAVGLPLVDNDSNGQLNKEIKETLLSFLQAILELYVGAAGEEGVDKLNSGLFELSPDQPDTISNLFESFDNIFQINYAALDNSVLDLVLDNSLYEKSEVKNDLTIIKSTADKILTHLVASCINYQELIDSHWRYLYSPKDDWGRFTKIAAFLEGVKLYVEEKQANARIVRSDELSNYYHDLKEVIERQPQTNFIIGTSNYSNLLEKITDGKNEIYHLNGKVSERYDPYTNEIYDESTKSPSRITVPLLFTQSGVKPLTSIEMAKRYVRLYEHYESCEHIGIIGFGFNGDDGHINGMFRQLCEQSGGSNKVKYVTVFHYEPLLSTSEENLIAIYKAKLRLNSNKKLKVVAVDSAGKLRNGELWYTALV